jgi:hypothetical protein
MDTGSLNAIIGIMIQPRADIFQVITKFKAEHSLDGLTYTSVEGGKEFLVNLTGSANTPCVPLCTTKVALSFGSVNARYIKLLPLTFVGWPSLNAGL